MMYGPVPSVHVMANAPQGKMAESVLRVVAYAVSIFEYQQVLLQQKRADMSPTASSAMWRAWCAHC